MIIYIYLTIAGIWAINALIDYNEFCYYWQLKEYRLDRAKDFLMTKQGKDYLKKYLILGRLVIFAVLIILMINKLTPTAVTVLIFFTIELLRNIRNLFKRKIRHPKFTVKAIILIVLSLSLEAAVWYLTNNVLLMLFMLSLRFLLFSSVVGLSYLPTTLLKDFYIILASRKMLHHPDILVIGITGSYGKSSVKVLLSQILKAKFKLISTPKNINTEIGIAKFIKGTDFTGVEVFIVEMGAYKKNEIKKICEMVKPNIGILTAINEQHLSLFGSIKNTQQAKYELLFSLPHNGLAVVNSDNDHCRELISEIGCDVSTFGEISEHNPTFRIKEKRMIEGKLFFKGIVKKNDLIEEFSFESRVAGEHNAMNIAPCFLAADHLGVEREDILNQLTNIDLPENTLKIINYGESVIIDDSYNSNPDGFLAALKYLDNYTGYKRVVITRGMLELGEKSGELHRKIGRMMAEHADKLIIINSDSEEYLREGVGDKMEVNSVYDQGTLLEYLKKIKSQKVAVLLENRQPEAIMKEINENNK